MKHKKEEVGDAERKTNQPFLSIHMLTSTINPLSVLKHGPYIYMICTKHIQEDINR